MSEKTQELAILVVAVCVLLGLNLWAAAQKVPIVDRNLSDGVTALVAILAVVIRAAANKPPLK